MNNLWNLCHCYVCRGSLGAGLTSLLIVVTLEPGIFSVPLNLHLSFGDWIHQQRQNGKGGKGRGNIAFAKAVAKVVKANVD